MKGQTKFSTPWFKRTETPSMNSIVATILIQRNYHRGRGYNSSQTLIKETHAVFKLQSQRKQRDTCTCSEKESIGKLTYFNFQGTKPLYQNNFSKLHSFSHFFRAINVISYCNSTKFLMGAWENKSGAPNENIDSTKNLLIAYWCKDTF